MTKRRDTKENRPPFPYLVWRLAKRSCSSISLYVCQFVFSSKQVSGAHLHSLPRIADPDISHGLSRNVVVVDDIGLQYTLLLLILIMKDEDREGCLLALTAEFALSLLDIFLQLLNCIFERRPGIIDLIDNENVFANQVGHLETAEIEPLRARDLGAGSLDGVAAQALIEGQADCLDRDVG